MPAAVVTPQRLLAEPGWLLHPDAHVRLQPAESCAPPASEAPPASGALTLTLKPTDDSPLELFLLYCPGDLQHPTSRGRHVTKAASTCPATSTYRCNPEHARGTTSTHLPSIDGRMALLTGFSVELYMCTCSDVDSVEVEQRCRATPLS